MMMIMMVINFRIDKLSFLGGPPVFPCEITQSLVSSITQHVLKSIHTVALYVKIWCILVRGYHRFGLGKLNTSIFKVRREEAACSCEMVVPIYNTTKRQYPVHDMHLYHYEILKS